MRDFRFIRDFEIQWKSKEQGDAEFQSESNQEGGEFDLEDSLNQMLEERGLGPDDMW